MPYLQQYIVPIVMSVLLLGTYVYIALLLNDPGCDIVARGSYSGIFKVFWKIFAVCGW